MTAGSASPLVSIIITSFNHARFLPESIRSALEQTYPFIETVLVDDGSTDGTAELVRGYPDVRYVYQTNSGLAAARNRGIDMATGDYLVFLDADDALLPEAVRIQLEELGRHPGAGMVSGGHVVADEQLHPLREVGADVRERHYEELLTRNYIGMHAAVLYRRSLLQEHRFDTELSACEDYDLYLRLSARYPVHSHTRPIALYRTLSSGMSGNLPNMLRTALQALDKQKARLSTPALETAFRRGQRNWRDLYGYAMAEQLRKGLDGEQRKRYLSALLRYKPRLYLRHYLNQILPISNR